MKVVTAEGRGRATGWGEKPIHGYKSSSVVGFRFKVFLNNVFLIIINNKLVNLKKLAILDKRMGVWNQDL